MAYDNTNSGALFKNEDKAEPNHPDYKGSLNVDGKEFWVAAWIKTGKKTGQKFMSLSVQSKDKKERAAQSKKEDVDSDIPF